ncbi:hypothetical protein B0H11DRAFT_1910416 [Mycena galericulata]|nr:hypothetical protein B0H11DRAFT_1910416 [Mycena galericulata]
MPPRRANSTISLTALPGGALETVFRLDVDAAVRSPPAPRRRTGRRQPVGVDNVGADPPSPVRTRRRRRQEDPNPTPAASVEPGPEEGTAGITVNHGSPSPPQPVASGSRVISSTNDQGLSTRVRAPSPALGKVCTYFNASENPDRSLNAADDTHPHTPSQPQQPVTSRSQTMAADSPRDTRNPQAGSD